MRQLTGAIRDLVGDTYQPGSVEAWIQATSYVGVDADVVRVGSRTSLALSGADGTFTVLLPDTAETGTLYRLIARWIEPAGLNRPRGPYEVGEFSLTDDATLAQVLVTPAIVPESIVGQLNARIDQLAAVIAATDPDAPGIPPGGATAHVLTKQSATDFAADWQPIPPTGGYGPSTVAASDTPAAIRDAVATAGGVVCNGTADQTDIQTLLDTYRRVDLTQGTYHLSAGITLPPKTTLVGAGPATILRGSAGMTGTAMIAIASNGDHCQVRDLQIDGSDATAKTGIQADITSQTGFATGSDACLILDNLLLRRIPGDGITMTGPYNRDSKLTRIQVWQAQGRGILIDCWDGSASMVITGDSGSHGIMLDTTSTSWRLDNCKSWYSSGDGIRIYGWRHTLVACEGQDSQLAGIRVLSDMVTLDACLGDSNSYPAATNVHAGIEIGRLPGDWNYAGGMDVTIMGARAADKNEGARGYHQRAGIRVRGGVRGLALIGGSTGDPAGPEHNVTAGIEWDEPADMTHTSNAVLAVSHRVRIP